MAVLVDESNTNGDLWLYLGYRHQPETDTGPYRPAWVLLLDGELTDETFKYIGRAPKQQTAA